MDQTANVQVIEVGLKYLQVVSLFYIVMGIMFLANGVLRGTGDIKIFVISSICNLTTRVFCAYLLAVIIGRDGIWWSIPIGWIVGSIISMRRYLSDKWQGKGIIVKQS
ncbi:MAG: MATE family efflux transporter [Niameybacter sp.]